MPRVSGPFRPLRLAALAFVAFALAFVAVGMSGWGVPAANEQAIGEVSRWCERVSGGVLREPVNTLGNLGFVIAGLAMFFVLGRDIIRGRSRHNRFIGRQPVALLYASAALFLGPGSMAMHGSHTRAGAWLDNVSMVAFILIPWLYNLALLGRWSDRAFFTAYGTLLSGYAAGYWFVGPDLGIGLDLFELSIPLWVISEVLYRFEGRWVRAASGLAGFAVGALFGVTPAVMAADPGAYWWVVLFWVPALVARHRSDGRRRYTPWYWLGFVSFLAAYAIWLTGTDTHPWCSPDSLVQAHAIWHLLSALATWCFFLFLRSERPKAGAEAHFGARPGQP